MLIIASCLPIGVPMVSEHLDEWYVLVCLTCCVEHKSIIEITWACFLVRPQYIHSETFLGTHATHQCNCLGLVAESQFMTQVDTYIIRLLLGRIYCHRLQTTTSTKPFSHVWYVMEKWWGHTSELRSCNRFCFSATNNFVPVTTALQPCVQPHLYLALRFEFCLAPMLIIPSCLPIFFLPPIISFLGQLLKQPKVIEPINIWVSKWDLSCAATE